MNKRNAKALRIIAIVTIALNIAIMATQIRSGDFGSGGTDLAKAKSYANSIVSDLQRLGETLNVGEKTSVKQALAKLHYDVFLVGNQVDLAAILQNNAIKTRDLILSEYARTNAEKVLSVLNSAQEIQFTSSEAVLTIAPLPSGGYEVDQPSLLQAETLSALKEIENLFAIESLNNYYESFRQLATFKIQIEKGVAQLVSQRQEQDTINYLEGEIETLRGEYTKVNKTAGFAEISGVGLIISVYDQVFSIAASDLRRIVGELYSAGAIAIDINSNRLAVNSYIVDGEDGVLVDGVAIQCNPVTIRAVGDATTLAAGVDLLFTVSMKGMFSFIIEPQENLVLPAKVIQ